MLNGKPVESINADLSATDADLTIATRLPENQGAAFIGTQKNGLFDVPGHIARSWLDMPINPNGRPNTDVVRPWINRMDVTRRSSDTWIIDFADKSHEEAAFYEMPFQHVQEYVRPARLDVRDRQRRENWWRLGRSGNDWRKAFAGIGRYIATPRVAKHRVFVWVPTRVFPDCQVVVIARDDDTAFGILHSRFHEAWSLRLCTWLGVGNDPRYTPTTTFETFTFPEDITPSIPAADYASDARPIRIAAAAKGLDELRRNWLNPPDLVRIEPEVVPGFPDRILPVDDKAAAILKTRTLTNLYNQRPTWLHNAHRELDAAVAAAYGWPEDISTDDALARLLELNKARAAGPGSLLRTGAGDSEVA
jgi:type II restriction/modification system DNA methylase subunit YeeA